jgi:hypothetical protein
LYAKHAYGHHNESHWLPAIIDLPSVYERRQPLKAIEKKNPDKYIETTKKDKSVERHVCDNGIGE